MNRDPHRGGRTGKTMAKDEDAFRQAMHGVRPLRHGTAAPAHHDTRPHRRPPRVPATDADAGLLPEARAEVLQADPRLLRRLRRTTRVDAEVDLHGLTEAQARELLQDFLAESVRRGHSTVRIVHGKGLRSGARGPVLRRLVHALLPRMAAVQAFVAAAEADGGSGASLVLLKAPPRDSPSI